jgi:hypothetical protein
MNVGRAACGIIAIAATVDGFTISSVPGRVGLSGRAKPCAMKQLEGDDAAIYSFGTNVGRQLTELCVFSPRELDLIFAGAKDMITQVEPRCDPQVHLPNGFGEPLNTTRVTLVYANLLCRCVSCFLH